MAAKLFIGTSGWDYEGWQDGFYAGIRRPDRLAFCARQFSAVEVNATFYRLQRLATFEKWRVSTPARFRFAIKANRYLTHNRKLNLPQESILLERERAQGLGEKLAAVVWQLPATLHKNLPRLQQFVAALALWPEPRHSVEFRHPSWFDEQTADCLADHGIAVCQSDAADWPLWQRVTTDLVYVRLHGHQSTYSSPYTTADLAHWCELVAHWHREGREVHVYFDNDALGAAPYNAMELQAMVLAELGFAAQP